MFWASASSRPVCLHVTLRLNTAPPEVVADRLSGRAAGFLNVQAWPGGVSVLGVAGKCSLHSMCPGISRSRCMIFRPAQHNETPLMTFRFSKPHRGSRNRGGRASQRRCGLSCRC